MRYWVQASTHCWFWYLVQQARIRQGERDAQGDCSKGCVAVKKKEVLEIALRMLWRALSTRDISTGRERASFETLSLSSLYPSRQGTLAGGAPRTRPQTRSSAKQPSLFSLSQNKMLKPKIDGIKENICLISTYALPVVGFQIKQTCWHADPIRPSIKLWAVSYKLNALTSESFDDPTFDHGVCRPSGDEWCSSSWPRHHQAQEKKTHDVVEVEAHCNAKALLKQKHGWIAQS
jgi:hypothetical protein